MIPHGAELLDMKRKYLSIMEVFIKRLASHSVLSRRSNSTNPEHYTKFGKNYKIRSNYEDDNENDKKNSCFYVFFLSTNSILGRA